MNKTLAFIGLDFNLIKPYTKGTLLMLGMGLVFGYTMKSPSMLSSFMMMTLMLIMSYPFAVGDKNGLDTLYGTLSLSKMNVVIGRYLFVSALGAIFAAITLLCSWLLSIMIGADFILADTVFTLCLLSGAFYLVVAFQYPIYFKMGYNKAKGIALIPLFAVFLVVMQLPTLSKLLNWDFSWEAFFDNMMGNSVVTYVVIVALGLILLALSCWLSCRIYSKRDI